MSTVNQAVGLGITALAVSDVAIGVCAIAGKIVIAGSLAATLGFGIGAVALGAIALFALAYLLYRNREVPPVSESLPEPIRKVMGAADYEDAEEIDADLAEVLSGRKSPPASSGEASSGAGVAATPSYIVPQGEGVPPPPPGSPTPSIEGGVSAAAGAALRSRSPSPEPAAVWAMPAQPSMSALDPDESEAVAALAANQGKEFSTMRESITKTIRQERDGTLTYYLLDSTSAYGMWYKVKRQSGSSWTISAARIGEIPATSSSDGSMRRASVDQGNALIAALNASARRPRKDSDIGDEEQEGSAGGSVVPLYSQGTRARERAADNYMSLPTSAYDRNLGNSGITFGPARVHALSPKKQKGS